MFSETKMRRKNRPCKELRQGVSAFQVEGTAQLGHQGQLGKLQNHKRIWCEQAAGEWRCEASETAERAKALAPTNYEDLSLLPESCPLTFTRAHEHQVNK